MPAEPVDIKQTTLRLPVDLITDVTRWGTQQGFVHPRGDVKLTETFIEIARRFLALEASGQHVTALLDAHTDPVLERLEVLTRVLAYLLGALPVEWFNAADPDAGWQVVTNAREVVSRGPLA